MTTTVDIAQAIGQKRMAEALNVGVTAVNNAIHKGRFPSSWLLVVLSLADEAGIECPINLFSLKPIADGKRSPASDL